MNTGKQINAMVIVLFFTVIAIGAYTIWDPFRSDSAADEQIEMAAERGATTFALNCRLCHGDRGEGGALGGRLPQAPALDLDFLRGFEQGALSEEALKEVMMLVTNTITCGRVGTFMPI
ncbi:MAG: cytochrome c, partial [Chloroflexi bacterium]|nr:cytochrome c [Chloroflexota bacterium]